MKLLKDRILKDGVVKPGNILKVDSFLNHQMDITLINEIGKEFKRRFSDCPITKILTIEASGIGIACIAAQYFDVPVVFAKKAQSVNLDGEMYTTKVESFTHKKVYDVILSRKFLGPEDHVLLIDDFLANGCALDFIFDIADKVVCNCTYIHAICHNNMEIQADFIVLCNSDADAMFQAVLSKKLYQSVLHTDCSHAYDTKTFYSNASCVGCDYICVNYDLT